jgi:hypothetical protein
VSGFSRTVTIRLKADTTYVLKWYVLKWLYRGRSLTTRLVRVSAT